MSSLGRGSRLTAWAAMMVFAALASGCSMMSSNDPENSVRIDMVAVLPIVEVPGRSDDPERPILDSHAGRAVTAQIYGFLAEQTLYRFVPDLTVDAVVGGRGRGDQVELARSVASEVGADAVIFGKVYRFQDRVGPRYAASQAASVSFDLGLYLVATDDVVWRGQFDETQVALSSNLLNFWMFWRAGPHWFSSRELARLGVESLLEQVPNTVPVLPPEF